MVRFRVLIRRWNTAAGDRGGLRPSCMNTAAGEARLDCVKTFGRFRCESRSAVARFPLRCRLAIAQMPSGNRSDAVWQSLGGQLQKLWHRRLQFADSQVAELQIVRLTVILQSDVSFQRAVLHRALI